MSFGRLPEDNQQSPQPQYGQQYAGQGYQQPQQPYANQPYGQQYQSNSQAPQYGQPFAQPQYNMAASGAAGAAGTATMNTNLAYSYEQAQRVSITRAYGEMTIGLLVTAAVAVLTNVTGMLESFIMATGALGWIGLVVVQVGLAIFLGARITKISTGTARVMFYVYAALMGFTLSSIFAVYSLGDISICLALCAGFFFALTMIGLTTKVNMLKAGPILLVGLIVLIVAEIIISIFFPGDAMLQIISAIGLLLFAGMTVYDAQATRALFRQYQSQGPEMIKKISILCALNLYLDFVNMFLYLLQLFGNRD